MEALYKKTGTPFTGRTLKEVQALLLKNTLAYDKKVSYTVALYTAENKLAATGSLDGRILKCIAVDKAYQGEGLLAQILTDLLGQALKRGHSHLFLYTKPQNENLFAPLGFYPMAKTDTVLLMENRKAGISQYKDRLKHETGQKKGDPVGAVVANCNPFTKGHRYLIETAASQCGLLHLFILTDGKVSLKERMALVKQGTQHIPNLVIHETGDYLVSRISFPDYFIKEAITEAWYDLDIAVFCTHIVPTLGITKRFVGTEPTCAVTSGYNKALKEKLPQQGVEIIEIPRLTINHTPVSASEVRRYLQEGQPEKAEPLVVEETLETIKKIYAFKREEDL